MFVRGLERPMASSSRREAVQSKQDQSDGGENHELKDAVVSSGVGSLEAHRACLVNFHVISSCISDISILHQ